MEPKKSSPQPQPHMETKKSPPRAGVDTAAVGAESPLSSLFHPPSHGMVNPSGVLLKVTLHTPRITNTRIHMTRLIRLVLVLLCTMVVEIIFVAALHPSKPQNPMIIRWTIRTPLQILMATGGKVHFTTKQIWQPFPRWTRN